MRAPRPPDPAPPRRHPLLRPAFLIPAGVLIAIIVALLAAPEFIDWNRYRDRISAAIEQKLGRAVSIEGALSLTLLPVPQMVAEQVHVANIAGAADQNFASADRLELRLRGLPLLAGRFEVSSLVLAHPRIHIERLADGRANWRFVPTPDIHVHSKPPVETLRPEGFQLLAEGDRAGLQRIELRNALITVRLPRVGTITAEGVDADATANGADGPFQFHLTGHAGDVPMALQGSVGRLDAKETPVDVTLDAGEGAARISVGGTMTGSDAATVMNGRLTIKAAHADRVAALLGTAAPDGPLELRGTIAGSLHDVAVQNITLDIPGASLSGFTAVNLEGDPQLDLKLAASRLDIAPWLKTKAPAGTAAEKKGTGGTPAAPSAVLSALSGVAFKIPAWLRASVDLSVESIPWHGVLIRGARLNALMGNGEVTINQVGATLPGGSQINLFGFIDSAKGKPSFDGSFETGTDDLRALLHWLAIDVGDVPEDRLGAARFTGHLAAAPDRIKLDGAEIRVDGTRITTAVDLRLPSANAPRPALGASFSVDTLNADAYRPRVAKSAAAPAASAASAASSGKPAANSLGALGQWLGSFDANIKGHVGQLVAGGITFGGLDLDGALAGGMLTLRSLSVADVDGAKANLSGKVAGLDDAPHFDGLKLDATAADPHVALYALGIAPPEGDLGALVVSAEIDGDAAGVLVQSHSTVAGLDAKIDGRVTDPLGKPAFDLNATLSHASLAGALHLLGLDYQHRAGSQPTSATFHMLGDPDRLSFDDVKLAMGDVAASGHASVAFGDRTRIEGALTAGDVPLDVLLGAPVTSVPAARPTPAQTPKIQSSDPTAPQAAPRPAVAVGNIPDRFSHAPIDLSWMRAVDGTLAIDAAAFTWGNLKIASPSAAITLADGKASLDKFTAKLWDGDLTATAVIDDSGALSCGAQLTKAQLKQATLGVADLNLADGVVDLSTDLTTTGNSPAELMGRLAGTGRIAARDGVLKGFDLKAASDRLKSPSAASLVTLVQAGARGETKFSALAGTIKATGGIFSTDDLTLTADGGTLSAKGAVNLPAYAMDAHADLHLAEAPDAPPLVLRLSGPLNNPRQVLDINPLQTWLAQRKGKPAQ